MLAPNIGTGHNVSPQGDVVCSYLPPPLFPKGRQVSSEEAEVPGKNASWVCISFLRAEQCDKTTLISEGKVAFVSRNNCPTTSSDPRTVQMLCHRMGIYTKS